MTELDYRPCIVCGQAVETSDPKTWESESGEKFAHRICAVSQGLAF